jgi:ATP-dependent DNA helicase RecG
VAGVLLFGKRLALRRLFPAARVDYVRVPGIEWVPDPGHRYESIEVREPLLVAFRRIYNAVVDELPKSCALEPGNPERRDHLAVPESVVREALVNALTHRDYRVASAVQVLRYQDRIEVRNPGYSLVEDEQLGEPGSFPRNPRIADVFREMKLAENKGTGVAAIRKVMQRAGLTPPLFDSDRVRNHFVVALWLHNLIGEDDTSWLRGFAAMQLTDQQARALVVARRTGSVSNAMLRDMSGLYTLAASNQLRQLRDQGLLEPRGKGSATHYVLGARARPPSSAAVGAGLAPAGASPAGGTKTGGFRATRPKRSSSFGRRRLRWPLQSRSLAASRLRRRSGGSSSSCASFAGGRRGTLPSC